jgi:hypothetical protein
MSAKRARWATAVTVLSLPGAVRRSCGSARRCHWSVGSWSWCASIPGSPRAGFPRDPQPCPIWHPAIPATTLAERPRNFGAVLRFGNQSATQNAADSCRTVHLRQIALSRAALALSPSLARSGSVRRSLIYSPTCASTSAGRCCWRLRAGRDAPAAPSSPNAMPDSTNPSIEADKPDCSL